MKKQTQKNLKGFRDFLPEEKLARDWLVEKMAQVAQKYGFLPLETPTLEYAELLTGKYGDEADKLLYLFQDRGGRKVGLRYDQTVPTARVLVQYQNELPKYFRRFQTQNVFRADKPQKGRWREFRQFDLDIFGSSSQVADAEILAASYTTLQTVGLKDIIININDRQTLIKTLEPFSGRLNVQSIIQTIDKLDKKTPAEVKAELVQKGLGADEAKDVLRALDQTQINPNLKTIVQLAVNLGVPLEKIKFSPTLARGLDYYTGMIFEINLDQTKTKLKLGSLGGGGRYDNLIQDLAGKEMPAVGVGLGFDRILLAAQTLNLTPKNTSTQMMMALYGPETLKETLETTQALRKAGISVEVYPSFDKLSKQFKVASQKQINYVAVLGPEEKELGKVSIKNLRTKDQQALRLNEVVALLSSANL